MVSRRTLVFLLVMGLLALSACDFSNNESASVVPTLASLETIPTAIFLTENAPPPGFATLALDPIERGLSAHSGWAYAVTGSFEGTFDATGEPAAGTISAQVQGNEPGQTRRVVLEIEGRAFLPGEALLRLEGVRFSNDYYTVDVNGVCTADGGEQPGGAAIADLSAGQIIGGVAQTMPTGHRQTLDGLPAWQYTFAPADARLPAIHPGPDGTVTLAADLWFAPEVDAVLRYEVSAEVSGVRLLWADSAVSGTLTLRYTLDVAALDTPPNISVPHGC
ncbi:MAG: hypothetical protein M5U29_05300 [Anaerolineae bacterium]|nr:hypothetical protein [Anaerolineae bacterium]